jgi:hypothetical protein
MGKVLMGLAVALVVGAIVVPIVAIRGLQVMSAADQNE